MHALVLFEFGQECVERFEVVDCGLRVQVEDRREGEAEEEVVCCAAGEPGRREVGELEEIRFREEEGVEPVDATFVAGGS